MATEQANMDWAVAELATAAGCSDQAILNAIKRGELSGYRKNPSPDAGTYRKHWRIPRTVGEKWLALVLKNTAKFGRYVGAYPRRKPAPKPARKVNGGGGRPRPAKTDPEPVQTFLPILDSTGPDVLERLGEIRDLLKALLAAWQPAPADAAQVTP